MPVAIVTSVQLTNSDSRELAGLIANMLEDHLRVTKKTQTPEQPAVRSPATGDSPATHIPPSAVTHQPCIHDHKEVCHAG